MNKILKNLNRNQELLVVILLAFGLFIFFSNQFFFRLIAENLQEKVNYNPSNFKFYFILIYELLIMAMLAYFLKVRGWKLQDFNLDISFKILGIGVLLLMFSNLILNIIYMLPEYLSVNIESTTYQLNIKPTAHIGIIILSSVIINPIFEEVFLVGYLSKWFSNFTPVVFIIVSITLRLSYHTYQGLWALTGMTIFGLILTLYYVRYKRLTPVVIAHALFNLSFYLRTMYEE
jgi:membrane protease YdiL (CAAX protease family)